MKKLFAILILLIVLPLLSGCGTGTYKNCSSLAGKELKQCERAESQAGMLMRIESRSDH